MLQPASPEPGEMARDGAPRQPGRTGLHPASPKGGLPLAHGTHAVPECRRCSSSWAPWQKVFEDFAYHREMVSADGKGVVLEFSATVHGKELKGIDMIQFDDEGKIVDFPRSWCAP